MIKSVAGLYKHMRDGVISLTNTFIDIDGECEVEKKTVECQRIHLKGILIKSELFHNLFYQDCEVKIRNIVFKTVEGMNGKCLELESCDGAEISGCSFVCHSSSQDKAPYPQR